MKLEDEYIAKHRDGNKVSKKNKKKFGFSKKFSTFAIPNETGVHQRMLAGQEKQD